MSIPGVPEGWEVVRWGRVTPGEWVCSHAGGVHQYDLSAESLGYGLVVRKIEKPKQYRPFANAEEFKPFRDRWWYLKSEIRRLRRPPAAYNDDAYSSWTWNEMFQEAMFDDGTPFGIKVSE